MECKEFLKAWQLKQQFNNCEKIIRKGFELAAITWGVYEKRSKDRQYYKVLIYRFTHTLEFRKDIHGSPARYKSMTFDRPYIGKGDTYEKAFFKAFSFIPKEYLIESEIIQTRGDYGNKSDY